MTFRQRLVWLIKFRWLVEWWIGPRAVALEHVTEKHAKAKQTLTEVHAKLGEIEGKITKLEGEIAKAERPDRTKLYELRSHRAELDKLRRREKVLTDRLDQLGEILHRFEIDDDYMPLSEHDQEVIRSVSDRLTKQADVAKVDTETMEDTAAEITEAIDPAGLDDELAALDREIKAKHAPPQAKAEDEPAGKLVPFPLKEKAPPSKDADKPVEPDWGKHAAAAREALRATEPKADAVEEGEPDPPAAERQAEMG